MFEDMFSRVATAPISWGICEVPEWGHQMGVDRVLAEMAELGFTHTELGSAGWLPEDPKELLEVLDRHNLGLLASFIPLVLHDPAQAETMLARAAEAAKLLQTTGATYFNTAPVTSDDWEPRRPYDETEWSHLYMMLGDIEKICIDHGLTQVVHEHFGCVVETAEETMRVLDNTDVGLVLDTGHLVVGGFDPVVVAAKYADRVGLVHLKDTSLEISARLNDGELSLMEAVQQGLFPALGEGDLPLAEVITTLEQSGYNGWYVIEQDCALTGQEPAVSEGPMLDVAESVKYLSALRT